VLTAAAFVRHNMPLGTTFDAPVLTDADAYDVAGYINSKDRPAKAGLDKGSSRVAEVERSRVPDCGSRIIPQLGKASPRSATLTSSIV
jgi:cytochrome c